MLGAALLLTLGLGIGYAQLGWTNDPEVITLEGSDDLDFYRGFVERWGSDELIVLAYPVENAFAPARLKQLRSLTDALLDLDSVRWVASLDTAFQIDTGPFGPYARPLVPDDVESAASLRAEALSSPFVRDALVSADGRALLLAVQLAGADLDNSEIERSVLAGIDRVLEDPEFADLQVHRAGSPVFNRALTELNQRDNALFTPLALVIIALLLSALFRSVLPTALALGVVGMSLVWTLGVMGWLGVSMNITTSLLPPLLMVIAVADAVHIIAAYIERLGEGDSRAQALHWTLFEVAPACFWTSLTTALGFASLLLVRIESVRVFGVFAVLGVWMAFAVAVIVLPAALIRLPLEGAARRRAELPVLRRLAGLASRPWTAIVVLVVALIIGAIGAPRIEVATHDGEFFQASHPINLAYRFIESKLQGVTPLEIEIRAPEPGALRSPAALRGIQHLQAHLQGREELTAGTSIIDLILSTSPGIDLADDAALERALFLLQTIAPEEVERFLHEDATLGRISSRAMAMTSAQSEALIEGLESRAAELFDADWQVRFTGLVPVFSQMEQYLVEGQLRSYLFAIFGIGVALWVIFRSLFLAVLALVANLVPIGIAAGIMGLAEMRLDVATIMVASVALGIIVDDTIHVLHAFNRALAQGLEVEPAVSRALEVAGRPVLLTSLILVCGFAALGLSDFQPTGHFGLLVSIAVAGALVADLIVLPAALMRLPAHITSSIGKGIPDESPDRSLKA